jgi:hypothetical protein
MGQLTVCNGQHQRSGSSRIAITAPGLRGLVASLWAQARVACRRVGGCVITRHHHITSHHITRFPFRVGIDCAFASADWLDHMLHPPRRKQRPFPWPSKYVAPLVGSAVLSFGVAWLPAACALSMWFTRGRMKHMCHTRGRVCARRLTLRPSIRHHIQLLHLEEMSLPPRSAATAALHQRLVWAPHAGRGWALDRHGEWRCVLEDVLLCMALVV